MDVPKEPRPALRVLRYILQELGAQYRVGPLRHGFVATLLGAVLVAALALGVDRGAGGMRIWRSSARPTS